MKTRDDILQVLSDLDASDRQWIVDHLPSATRAALLGRGQASMQAHRLNEPIATGETTASSIIAAPLSLSNESDQVRAFTRLAHASAESVRTLIDAEPAWVLHALLQDSRWPWRDALLQSLRATLRNEVESLDVAGVRYANKLVQTLVSRVSNLLIHDVGVEKLSLFDDLVSKLGARFSRHRQGMRI